LGNNSLVDWSTRGTVRPIYGTLSICFALVTIPFYMLSAIIMFALAISDMCTLLSNALAFGVFLIRRSRTWKILAVSYLYPSFIAFFTPPFFFNSDVHLLITNPGINEDKYE
ncbi:hypothetical protein PFISCL1PPCAC_3047, partial [Pristionchus fissidentatus]